MLRPPRLKLAAGAARQCGHIALLICCQRLLHHQWSQHPSEGLAHAAARHCLVCIGLLLFH